MLSIIIKDKDNDFWNVILKEVVNHTNVQKKVLPDCLTPIVSSGVGARPVTSLVISIS